MISSLNFPAVLDVAVHAYEIQPHLQQPRNKALTVLIKLLSPSTVIF
jgi:hypothetical protein